MPYSSRLLVSLCLSGFILWGCEAKRSTSPSESDPVIHKASSGGKTLEVIVVCPTDIYKGDVADAVNKLFAAEQPYLNQAEPLFDLVPMQPQGFYNSEMFQRHRNIIIIKCDPSHVENKLYQQRHSHSYPQAVFEFSVKSKAELMPLLEKSAEYIRKTFYDNEYLRVFRAFKQIENTQISEEMSKKFHFRLTVSEDFYLAVNTVDFMWLRQEPKDASLNICIHTKPYYVRQQLDSTAILQLRDSIGKSYIPGPTKGAYMTTEKRFPIGYETVEIEGMKGKEMRGLWKLDGQNEGDVRSFMGGPFVNYTLVDEKNQRLIMIDCFLYSPRRSKRDLLVQLESVVRRIRFTTGE